MIFIVSTAVIYIYMIYITNNISNKFLIVNYIYKYVVYTNIILIILKLCIRIVRVSKY